MPTVKLPDGTIINPAFIVVVKPIEKRGDDWFFEIVISGWSNCLLARHTDFEALKILRDRIQTQMDFCIDI